MLVECVFGYSYMFRLRQSKHNRSECFIIAAPNKDLAPHLLENLCLNKAAPNAGGDKTVAITIYETTSDTWRYCHCNGETLNFMTQAGMGSFIGE